MKKFKSLLAAALAATMTLSFTACTSDSGTPPSTDPPKVSQSQALETAGSDSEAQSKADGGAVSDVSYEKIPFLKDYVQYKQDGEINVLYLVCTTLAEYFPNSHAVWEPMLAEHNINIELVGPPSYSDESLISTLESALASGKYDVILLYPITPSAITPLLEPLWEQYHIPIVAFAFSPETGCGNYYMGTSYYSAGQVMGQSIIDYVDNNKEYFDTLDTIPVAVYKNAAGGEQYQRITGALDVLEADGRFTLIDEYEANGEAVCLTATETLLTSHPDVEIILTQIDNDVTGTYQTVISGSYECSDYLSIWGFDATGAVCSLMAQDGQDGFVQGSAFIDHIQAGEALCEFLPIVSGAAKQGELIDFTQEEKDFLGTILADYYITVTPENVNDYYTPAE